MSAAKRAAWQSLTQWTRWGGQLEAVATVGQVGFQTYLAMSWLWHFVHSCCMTGTCFASRWKIYWHSEGSRHQHIGHVYDGSKNQNRRRRLQSRHQANGAGHILWGCWNPFLWEIYCQRGSGTAQDWRLCNFMIHPTNLAWSKDSWVLHHRWCQVRFATSQVVGRQEGFQVHRRPVPLQKACRNGGICLFSSLGLTSFEDGVCRCKW